MIGGGEIYQALERGLIDATEWVGPYDDEKLGFHRIADNYYYPGWWEPGPTVSLYVNLDAWNKLSIEYQEMFRTASVQTAMWMTTQYDTLNPAALERLVSGGVVLRPFSDEIMAAAEAAAFDLYEEQASADPVYRNIYDAWKTTRAQAYRWFSTAERAYADYAFGRTGQP